MTQDQKIGQILLTVVEKQTGDNMTIVRDVCADVPMSDLVDHLAREIQAGEGHTRKLAGETKTFTPVEGRRAYALKKVGGIDMDNGLTLFEAGIRSGDTVELHKR